MADLRDSAFPDVVLYRAAFSTGVRLYVCSEVPPHLRCPSTIYVGTSMHSVAKVTRNSADEMNTPRHKKGLGTGKTFVYRTYPLSVLNFQVFLLMYPGLMLRPLATVSEFHSSFRVSSGPHSQMILFDGKGLSSEVLASVPSIWVHGIQPALIYNWVSANLLLEIGYETRSLTCQAQECQHSQSQWCH